MSLKQFAKKHRVFLCVSFFYLIVILFIHPSGNFPVNDDWIFGRQVLAFLKGNFKLSLLIDPAFILQGFIGYFWSLLFGFSFYSLRILTICMSLFMLFGFYKTLNLFALSSRFKLLILLCAIFNPVVLSSSMTFMTEIYFLCFFVWSIYFYLRFLQGDTSAVYLGTLFVVFSFLVRQVGILTFFALLSALAFKKKKLTIKQIIITVLLIFVGILIWYFWPHYKEEGIGSMFIEAQFVKKRLSYILFTLPSLVYFLAPVLFLLRKVLKKRVLLIILFLSFFVFMTLYKYDIFPLGSVFYLEELHSKSTFRSNFSFFDNIPIKLGLALFLSFNIFLFLYSWRKIADVVKSGGGEVLFLLLASLLMFLMLFISTDIYDRYLLPILFPYFIFLSVFLSNIPVFDTFLAFFVLGAFIFISVTLNYEYMRVQNIKWQQSAQLQEKTGLQTQIYLDGTYTKYTRAAQEEDFTGTIKTMPNGLVYKCYIQNYTVDTNGVLFEVLDGANSLFDKFFDNPKVYDRRKVHGMPSIKKHLDDLIYNEEYFSVVYNMVGKRAFVGSYCIDE